MKRNDLEVYISKDSSTLPIMDKFETTECGEKLYERMIIKNIEKASIGLYIYSYKLIVERLDIRECDKVGNITMSEFKKHKGKVIQYATKSLLNYLENHKVYRRSEIYFEQPYYLRAQNSLNRTGYGWEWEWDNLIYQGTEYGECDDYGFVGIIIEDIVKNKDKNIDKQEAVIDKTIPDPVKIEVGSFHGKKYYKVYANDTNVYMLPFKNGLKEKQIIHEYKKIMYEKKKRNN